MGRRDLTAAVVVHECAAAPELAHALPSQGKLVSYPARLEALEKVASEFFSDRVAPIADKAKSALAKQGVNALLRSTGEQVGGLWRRLNGQGRADREQLPHDVPVPPSSRGAGPGGRDLRCARPCWPLALAGRSAD